MISKTPSSDDHPYIHWLLSCGMALILMSTDMYVPSLPAMVQEFATTEDALQWSISVNALGYCLASPFVGPLADAYGRRLVLNVSLVGFALISLVAAFSPTLFFFDTCRFIQGLFGAALPIVVIAVITDLLKGGRFVSVMAYMGLIITMSFAVAPVIGGFIGDLYGWRPVFYVMAGAGAILAFLFKIYVPETLPKKIPFSLKTMTQNYVTMIKDPIFIGYCMITALMLAGFFSYITTSSYLYIQHFGLSKSEFGVLTGIGMIANTAAHLFVGQLVERLGASWVLRLGMLCLASSAVVMAYQTFIDVSSPYILLIPVLLFNTALGFAFPPTASLAMDRFREMAGTSSAFASGFRMLFLGAGTYLAGKTYNGTLASFSSIFILCGALAVATYLWVNIRNNRQKASA